MPNLKFIDSTAAETISQLAQDEAGKRQYYRPVYSLHKWWARRPGALFRSLILLARYSDQPLFQFHRDGSLSSASEYFKSQDLSDLVIFDPFMGGGTTLVEANRLGAKVIGCDLNPVAYWIVRETLKSIDLNTLESYYQTLANTVGDQIKSLYKTKCSHCQAESDSLYAFWVRYVNCSQCGEPTYLFKNSLLNHGFSRTQGPSATNPATAFCPNCFTLNLWEGVSETACHHCGHHFSPSSGTYDQGYYSCSHCHTSHLSLINSLKNGQRLREQLVAIEYLCSCQGTRTYKAPDAEDLTRLTHIEETVKTLGEKLSRPTQPILAGDSSVRWLNHNYRYYHEVFNARQLLAFHYLIEAIRNIPAIEYQNAFFTIFSNSLEYNNMMTPYNHPHRKLHHLFNYHAMPLTTMPVENAVWGLDSEGAGTFVNCYYRYRNAKKYCQEPFDKFKDATGKICTISALNDKIEAHLVSSFPDLIEKSRSAWLLCSDSSKLPTIPEGSVDLVITDPPYFDSIHYSELSNFFYIWLRLLIQHESFAAEQVPTAAEAIVNQGMEKGESEYQELLTRVFKESHRVLKKSGKLIFTFHHTKWQAWWTVLQALIGSGFQVTDSFSVRSEYKVNPHIRNKQALDMDLVLVCQKQLSVANSPKRGKPAVMLQQIVQELTEEKVNEMSDNQLFLHFMGKLLKIASTTQADNLADYHWFADTLTHFDEFKKTLIRIKPKLSEVSSEPMQLKLLD